MDLKKINIKIVKKYWRHFKKSDLFSSLIKKPWLIFIPLLLVIATIFLLTRRSINRPPTFKKASLFSSWQYQAKLPNQDIVASAKATQSDAIINFQYQNSSIEFKLPLENSSLSQDETNQISFNTKDKNIEAQYQISSSSLKENIILHKTPTTNQFTSSFKTTNADIYINSSGLPVFLHPKDQSYLFHFEKPYAVDATGQKTYAVTYQLIENDQVINPQKDKNKLSLLGNLIKLNSSSKYQIIVKVDSNWLFDPSRVYPITIDPTVVHDTSTEFATGQFNRLQDVGTGDTAPSLTSYYQELPTDAHTVALWHMNEASGNLIDSSGNGHTGTVTGTTVTTGLLNNARTFNGSSDYANSGTGLNLTGTQVTVEAWVKPTGSIATNGRSTIISNFNASTGGYILDLIDTADVEGYRFWINSTSCSYYPPSIPSGWTHLTGSYDGSNLYIYENGELKNTCVKTGNIVTSTTALTIGKRTDGYYYSGQIDEIRISNIARSPEEIKQSASRRPYSIYTSPVSDLTISTSWNSFFWTESGVATGDGETLADNTSLVAQWNFNESSGTTASVSSGSCSTTCNGTLTNFATTTSQDAANGTGWTANNRRWGAGALMFDGSNDFITVPHSSAIDFNQSDSFSIEAWVKPNLSGTQQYILEKQQNTTNEFAYALYYTSSNQFSFALAKQNVAGKETKSPTFPPGQWYHIVGVTNGTTIYIYVNGVLCSSAAINFSSATQSLAPLYIGQLYNSTLRWNGIIDSTRIYSRALTSDEIISNYNSSNLEIQTRVGSSADPNDGTWEAWSPTTSESQLLSLDSDTSNWTWDLGTTTAFIPQILSNSSVIKMEGSASLKLQLGVGQTDANTVGLWHLDETNTAVGTTFNDSSSNNNHGVATTVPTVIDGFFGKARKFNGTTDVINLGNPASLQMTGNQTIEMWLYPTDFSARRNPFAKAYGGEGNITQETDGAFHYFYGTAGANSAPYQAFSSLASIPLNKWSHVAIVRDLSNMKLYWYINGVQTNIATASYAAATASSLNAYIGQGHVSNYAGSIDEVRISSSAKSAAEISEIYRNGRDRYLNRVISSVDLSGKTALPFYIASDRLGTFSQFSIGESGYANNQPDSNTLALWHLDESDNQIIYDLGGTSINIQDWAEIDPNNNKISQNDGIVLSAGSLAAWDSALVSQQTFTRQGGLKIHATFTTSSTVVSPNHMMIGFATNSTSTPSFTNITHALYFNGGSFAIYQDGASLGAVGSGYAINTTYEIEVTLNAAGTQASYAVKGGAYTNWTTLYAADVAKTNTPLRVQISNYRHTGTFKEISVYTPISIKDSSGNGNHGTSIGGYSDLGKIGKSRNIHTTTSSINMGDVSFVDSLTQMTYSFWINPNSLATYRTIIAKANWSGSSSFATRTTNSASDEIYAFVASALSDSGSNYFTTSDLDLKTNQWTHLTIVYDGSLAAANRIAVYKNAQKINGSVSGTIPTNMTSGSTSNLKFGFTDYTGHSAIDAKIDEVRFDNIARTPEEIRQAYEIGARTHNITIDFKAKLVNSNLLVGSTDYSFDIDTIAYGLGTSAANLYLGDKIIIKENVGGTEYLAQGTVNSLTASTGAVTVSSWDSGSTFPSGGYTINAIIFKWQREYFDVTSSLSSHRDAITNLTLHLFDTSLGTNIWLDDLKSSGPNLTNSIGSTITSSTHNRYFQYRSIFTSHDPFVSSSLQSLTLDYTSNLSPNTPTLSDDYLHDNVKTFDTTPEIRFTGSDPENDNLTYQFQWDTDSSFGTGTTATSGLSSGFSNVTTVGNTSPFIAEDIISYTFQSPLSNNSTYFYRVRTNDPSGSTSWSDWSATKSLTIDTSLATNAWFQTHADQFQTDSLGVGISINNSGNYVEMEIGSTGISSWLYRKTITLTNSGSELTDEDVLVEIDTATLISAGKLQSDCDDLRFMDSDNTTLLDFWVEGGCNTSSTQVWVKVPTVPNGNKNIYFYYGNSGASNAEETWSGNFVTLSTISCPTGWTRDSTFDSRFPMGSASVGTTGGSASHNHSNLSCTSGVPSSTKYAYSESGYGTYYTRGDHTHTMSATMSSASALPPYLEMYFCSSPRLDLNSNLVYMNDTSLPSGWTRFSSLDDKFAIGATSYGGTGGSATHVHAYTGATTSSVTGTNSPSIGGTPNTGVVSTHTHTVNSSNTASGNNLPEYKTLLYSSPNSVNESRNNLISMSSAIPPLGWALSSSYDNKYLVGATTPNISGGTNTHTHSATLTTTSSAQSGTYNYNDTPRTLFVANSIHSHSCSVTTSSVNNLPPYITTLFVQRKTSSVSTSTGSETQNNSSILSTPIIADNLVNPSSNWYRLSFNDDETYGNIVYQIYYDNNGTPTIIPDTDLSGNSIGFTTSPVDISSLSTWKYSTIYLKAIFTYSGGSPLLYDWGVSLFLLPPMPGNCLIDESNTDSGLNVKWEDRSTNEDGFRLERSTDGGAFSSLTTLSAGTTAYPDSTATSGHTYQYRITPYLNDPADGWPCLTSNLNLQNVNNFLFDGLKMQGLQLY